MCRHTVGLNYTAIGIEHVGTSDAQILHDPQQLAASLKLTLWLMTQFHISLGNVIGHSESLTSPYHRELYAPWRCQTHADWLHADMTMYRTGSRRSRAASTSRSRSPGTQSRRVSLRETSLCRRVAAQPTMFLSEPGLLRGHELARSRPFSAARSKPFGARSPLRKSSREDAVRLVDVAVPERPRHLLEASPRDDRERRRRRSGRRRPRARPTSRAASAPVSEPFQSHVSWSCAVSGSARPMYRPPKIHAAGAARAGVARRHARERADARGRPMPC